MAHISMCEGDEGIPLWVNEPTIDNIPYNIVAAWLNPYVYCVTVLCKHNGTSLVIHDGIIAYAVTECLIKVINSN